MSVNIWQAAKKSLAGLLQAKENRLNEADTLKRVIRFFSEQAKKDAGQSMVSWVGALPGHTL